MLRRSIKLAHIQSVSHSWKCTSSTEPTLSSACSLLTAEENIWLVGSDMSGYMSGSIPSLSKTKTFYVKITQKATILSIEKQQQHILQRPPDNTLTTDGSSRSDLCHIH